MRISPRFRLLGWLLTLNLLPFGARAAGLRKVPFSLPGSPPVGVFLVAPEAIKVLEHTGNAGKDSIRAQVDEAALNSDYAQSLLVEVIDTQGTVRWKHDFGFNFSAPQGNTVAVTYRPALRLLLIEYDGYKWDHAHCLLFAKTGARGPVVREYDAAKRDLLLILKRREDFPEGFDYWIYPSGFTGHNVEFTCIPLQQPARQAVHPFAQEEPWYRVTAKVGAGRRMIPVHVERTH